MAWAGLAVGVAIARVLKVRARLQQGAEAASEQLAEAIEVVVPHLVDRKDQEQPRAGCGRLSLGLSCDAQAQQGQQSGNRANSQVYGRRERRTTLRIYQACRGDRITKFVTVDSCREGGF